MRVIKYENFNLMIFKLQTEEILKVNQFENATIYKN